MSLSLWEAWKHGFYGSSLEPDVKDEKLFSALMHKYTEEHRSYHSLFHLNNLLEELQDYCNYISLDDSTKRELYLTILYHDSVYDIIHRLSGEKVKPGDNENESIKYFKKHRYLVSNSLSENITQNIVNNIEASKYKKFKSECLFGDFDLAALGASWNKYHKNSERIIEEFSTYFTPQEVFTARLQFLSKLLEVDRIYYSEYFYMNYEIRAKENITKDVELLKKLV
jgi:predicted metal-dependent HD superfamily phosphohydrolase